MRHLRRLALVAISLAVIGIAGCSTGDPAPNAQPASTETPSVETTGAPEAEPTSTAGSPATNSTPQQKQTVQVPQTDDKAEALALFCETFTAPALTAGLVELAIADATKPDALPQAKEDLKEMVSMVAPDKAMDAAPANLKGPASVIATAFRSALTAADKSPLQTAEFRTASQQIEAGLPAICH